MKIKSLFALAVLAVTSLTGCSNTNDPSSESGEQTIYLKLGNVQSSVSTKSDEAKLGNSDAVTLTDGYIFFITAQDGIKDFYRMETGSSLPDKTSGGVKIVNINDLKTGKGFANVSGEVEQVYIVGNLNLGNTDAEDAIIKNFSTLTNLKKQLISIGTQNNATDLTIDGIATVQDAAEGDFGGAKTGDRKAVVSLTPLCSRIQIDKVTAEGVINNFTLNGIYVNKFYDIMPLNSVPTSTVKDLINFPADYTAYSSMFDYEAAVGGLASTGSTNLVKTPTNGTWAYQFFVGDGAVPRVVLQMSSFSTTDGTAFSGTQYLNIRGFMEGTTQLTKLERGKIYQITDVTFKENNLSQVADPEDVSLWVQVTVKNWVVTTVTPVL